MKDENKIVIFDWGGVVTSFKDEEYTTEDALKKIVIKLNGIDDDKKTITEKWVECDFDENGKCVSEINKKEDILKWFERIKLNLKLKCDYKEFRKVYLEEIQKTDYYKDVVDFAHSLKDKCKIGILSNLCSLDKPRIDKHYNLSKFDYVWLSFEMECKKPKEEIYIKVENDCKIKPDNILFIDDVMENLIPAQKRGWNICNANGHELDKIKKSVEEFLK